MKKTVLLLFVLICCAINANAQKVISYKIHDGKAYYKVVEDGKEPMFYRKKLENGNVALDFEKLSNGIFGYQYDEVVGEVKYLKGEESVLAVKDKELKKQAEKKAAQEREAQEQAEKKAAQEELARQRDAEEAEKQLLKLQLEKANIEKEIDEIGTKNMTTEEKLLYQLLQENKEQKKHLATLKWISVVTTAISVGSSIGYIIATLIRK